MLRTFIAVKIAPTHALRNVHSQLAELAEQFRPASLANLHVTLKFLGDTAESQISDISTVVERVAHLQPRFTVQLVGLGVFPHIRRPSVVWVGMTPAEPLCRLAAELDCGLTALGFSAEGREFQPHLTILRVKSRPPEGLFTLLAADAQTDFGMTEISHVELVESQLGRGGPHYTTLAKYALGVEARRA